MQIICIVETLVICHHQRFIPSCDIFVTGHIAHEWTPWSSFESIFTFIEEKLSLPNDEIHSTETQKMKQTKKSKTIKQTVVNFFTKKK